MCVFNYLHLLLYLKCNLSCVWLPGSVNVASTCVSFLTSVIDPSVDLLKTIWFNLLLRLCFIDHDT